MHAFAIEAEIGSLFIYWRLKDEMVSWLRQRVSELCRVYTSATSCAQQAARNLMLVARNKLRVARNTQQVALV